MRTNRRRVRLMVLRSLATVWSGSFQPRLVSALTKLSEAESATGRAEPAEAAAAEAVRLARRLTAASPGKHLLLLARAVGRHAACQQSSDAFDQALAELAEASGHYEAARDASPQAAAAGLAETRTTVAVTLNARGRPDEALGAAEDAIVAWRALLPSNPKRYAFRLAHSLNVAAGCLGQLGRHEEAVAAGSEAVDLYRRLTLRTKMRCLYHASHARVRLAKQLRIVGRPEEALVHLDAALPAAEAFAWRYPITYGSHLAWLRYEEAVAAADLGLHPQATKAARAALTQCRSLSDLDPTHQARLADTLRCWADIRAPSSPGDAVTALREAVEIRSRLSSAQPEANRTRHANDLWALADVLWALDRVGEAISAYGQAVDLYRQAAAEDAAHEPRLVEALNSWANRLDDAGDLVKARDAASEAATVARRLADDDEQDSHLDLLAVCLYTLSSLMARTGQEADAVQPARESVALRRRLTGSRPDADQTDLARGLNNLAIRLIDANRSAEEATAAFQEAAAIYRSATTDVHQSSLALTLSNLALTLADTGRAEDAITHLDEAIAIRTRLDPTPENRRSLAISLCRRAKYLADNGRHAEAIPDLDRATTIYQALSRTEPGKDETELAWCLKVTAIQLARVDRVHQAVETLDVLRDLARQSTSPLLHQLYLDAIAAIRDVASQPMEQPDGRAR
ncbi:tetratricopeptide repeat protein [Micromonospora pisi]|uniref:Tetratricopeptide repeat protein n=1 Tax=Micromonospora pisi TaxID=589240 RepID=A0A495JCH0_9ACTN|nr:tetratricopeptide repeat protein [Micromonospora pisi]RKR86706.1 tetratricopeptide repeat protein [Micromonospora pisi]